MTEAFVQWWRLRTPRERWLVAVMLALFAFVIGWLLVVRPLSDALDSAKRRHAEAVELLAEARVRAEAARPSTDGGRATAPRPVDSFLGRTATEAGFTGARVNAQGPARATVAIDAARPQAFFAWVRQMETSGLEVESLRARANDDRTLAVEALFAARGD